jgi:pectate lyase
MRFVHVEVISGVLVSLLASCGGSSEVQNAQGGAAADGGAWANGSGQAGTRVAADGGRGARAGGGAAAAASAAGSGGRSAGAGGEMSSGGAGVGRAASGGAGVGRAASGGAAADGAAAGEGGAAADGAGAAGGTGGATASSGDCSMPPAADAPVGFATVDGPIDGGGMSAPKLITSFADLKAAVSGDAPATVWIKGSLTGDLTVGSNKSLVGVCGAELHGHIEISGVSNVIVRNLTIVGYGVGDCSKDPSFDASVGCSSGHDAMSIQRSAHNIWIDHCDISDGTDGNLDITNAANHVTVSWTKFHYTARADNSGDDSTGASGHRFSNLVGSSDTPKTDDAHALAITWHHDWWADNVVERQPRVRFGQNHLFNDLWSSAQASDCVAAGKQAQIWVEHSIFHGVKNPLELRSADKDGANIRSDANSFDDTSGSRDTGGGGPALTSVPYPYTPDDTSTLEQAIRDGAGPH